MKACAVCGCPPRSALTVSSPHLRPVIPGKVPRPSLEPVRFESLCSGCSKWAAEIQGLIRC